MLSLRWGSRANWTSATRPQLHPTRDGCASVCCPRASLPAASHLPLYASGCVLLGTPPNHMALAALCSSKTGSLAALDLSPHPAVTAWALNLVRSRSFSVTVGKRGATMIVPLADLCNHAECRNAVFDCKARSKSYGGAGCGQLWGWM